MDEKQKKLAEELLFSGKKNLSFAKKLFFGQFDPKNIFPFPSTSKEETDEVSQLLEELKKFTDKELDADWIDRHAAIPDKIIEKLASLGILGMTVDKQHGGLGYKQQSFCRVVEFLSARCGSTALFVNVHQSIGLRALLIFGTEEQKGRWLLPLAHGEQFAAFSLTEPNAGSDASGVESRAVFDQDRQVYIINGKKQWTTNGSIADILTVMAKTEIDTPQGKQDKITAFLVTPDMPGFIVTNPSLEKVGMRGTKTANLEFNNMIVPAANVLGPMGGGLRVCLTVLDYGRTAFGASCTGAAKYLLQRAVEHAKNRHQFNRPLASFGLVKEKIANMAALAYAMEATTYLTAGLIDAGEEDIMLEAAMLKVFASDALWSIIYDTMQIFGGRSFFTDQPFERMMRDARLNMIGEGSNEVLRAFIGAVGMRDVGMELKELLEKGKTPFEKESSQYIWGFLKKSFGRFDKITIPVESKELQKEAQRLSSAIRRFGFAVIRVLAAHREKVIEEQLILNRISIAAMSLYTIIAVLGKAESDKKELATAKYYCEQGFRKFDDALNNLFDPLDQQTYVLADKLTL